MLRHAICGIRVACYTLCHIRCRHTIHCAVLRSFLRIFIHPTGNFPLQFIGCQCWWHFPLFSAQPRSSILSFMGGRMYTGGLCLPLFAKRLRSFCAILHSPFCASFRSCLFIFNSLPHSLLRTLRSKKIIAHTAHSASSFLFSISLSAMRLTSVINNPELCS